MENLNSLKANPQVLSLYRERVALKKESGNWTGKCPLHSEKTGSFVVNLKDGVWLFKCFGCGEGGSIIDLVQKMDGCSLADAIKTVREKLSGWSADKQKVEETFKPIAEEKPALTLTLEQYKKFEDALEKSEEAKSWLLKERGIEYSTTKKLHVGYILDIGLKAGKENQDISDKGWLTFPYIYDNMVVGIKYRSIVRKVFTHQPGMKTTLFNLEN
jgi:DNA primase